MALSNICNSFCRALPEEPGTSAQLLPFCKAVSSCS